MNNNDNWGNSSCDNSGDTTTGYVESDRSKSKAYEIMEGSVVIEIYEKLSEYKDRLFFDLRYFRSASFEIKLCMSFNQDFLAQSF